MAYAFMKRLIKTFGEATVLTIDKAPALLCAYNKLREQGFYHFSQEDSFLNEREGAQPSE